MSIIIGNSDDIHVRAVADQMISAVTVLDAAAILSSPVTLSADGLRVGGQAVSTQRGWLRRLAPEGWTESTTGRGANAAVRSAAVSTLAAIARDERILWLTPLDALGAAENKPYQYRRASNAGVPVPRWIVTTDPETVPRAGAWVSKPLGPGSFIDSAGRGRIVPTAEVDLSLRDLIVGAPFVLQERIRARAHARVVTVGPQVCSATLEAGGLPLDWRQAAEAHHSFTDRPAPDAVHELALAAARSVGVGYSAQDWISGEDGTWWLVDMNPAGQWLFLPREIAMKVTKAIARFLDGDAAA